MRKNPDHRYRPNKRELLFGDIWSAGATVSQRRIALLDKRMYASFKDAATFGERFLGALCGGRAANAAQIVVVSDGRPWVHTFTAGIFSWSAGVLDPWHLARKIQMACGAESGGLVERCLADAWRGDVRSLVRRLRACLAQERDRERRTKGKIYWQRATESD